MQRLVDQAERSGHGATVQSWVGTGANQPISADRLRQVAGPTVLGELAAKAGLSTPYLAGKLAAPLPQAVDALTPHGRVG